MPCKTRNGLPLHVPRAGSKIVPLTTIKQIVDRRTGETSIEEVTLTQDEGMRHATLQGGCNRSAQSSTEQASRQ